MRDQITLTGTVQYNEKYPPSGAKKGYLARITGRVSGPIKYEREFLGSEVTILPGDEGLYEKQRGDKKGGATRWYYVILSHPEHGLIRSTDCEEELPKIAKLLDDGISIEDAVEVTNLRPHDSIEDLMVFDVVPRTASQAKKAKSAATIDEAVENCWQALVSLSAGDAKKAVAELRKRIPTASKTDLKAETPIGILADRIKES